MPPHVTDSWRDFLGPGALLSFSLAVLVLIAGLGTPLLFHLRQVVHSARRDERESADAILVLGRVLEGDQPGPVFRARLDHGATLFRRGFAPRLLVAGGRTGNASRTEAEAGFEHLVASGIPAAAVLREEASRHTLENLFNVRATLRRHGWCRLLVVSDPLHLARAAALARGLGLDVRCSPAAAAPPAPGSPGWWARALREAFHLHWYHVGVAYSRLIRSKRLLARVT